MSRSRAIRLTFVFAVCLAVGLVATPPATADVSGFVLEQGTNNPIQGARVHLQGDPSNFVLSAADGSFTLPASFAGFEIVAANVEYDRAAPANWTIGGFPAMDGAVGVQIFLEPMPTTEDPFYNPPEATLCGNCHGQQYADWQASNHSLAAMDSWVLDLFSGDGTPGGSAGYVFRDLHDPDDTGFCATCHTPMAEAFDPGNIFLNEITEPFEQDGVSCLACHQIDSVNTNTDALHLLGNATYRFPESPINDTWQFVWGPLPDSTTSAMAASYAPFFQDPLMCASCHQYNNPDTGAPGQTTYTEWQASPWAVPGPAFRTCQDCHMPPAPDPGTICILGDSPVRPPEQRRSHEMIGATPETLSAAILLDTTADDAGGLVRVRAEVTNQGAGHSFPTGVSLRNAMVVIEASYGGQTLSQVSGPTIPFWADDDVPGKQPGDYAGFPGKGFARVLEGRINGQGPVERPVLFIDAEAVYSATQIPSGETDVTEVAFQLPVGALAGDEVEVSARLLYRRAWRATAVTKGWTVTPQGGPVEIEVAADVFTFPLVEGGAGSILEIPAADARGLALLTLLLALGAVGLLRRQR